VNALELLADLDAHAPEPFIVYGALPPEGRDLDLVVGPAAQRELSAYLSEQGFGHRGIHWARFRGCRTEAVDLMPVERWALPADQVTRLFEDGHPLPRLRFARLPSPQHTVLILARLTGPAGTLKAERRPRLERALAEDRGAWAKAEALAPAWRVRTSLAILRKSLSGAGSATRRERASAAAELRRTDRTSGLRAVLVGWRAVLRRRRRGVVVAISGLDGSGKTTQVTALHEALATLGYDVAVEWTRLGYEPALGRVAVPVKRVMGRLVGRRSQRSPTSGRPSRPTMEPGTSLRRRSRLLTTAWATFVAVANASWQRRVTRPHLRLGRVVICDRYTLDSAAWIRSRYGGRRTFQIGLLRLRSVKPTRSYFLEVSPETALARKEHPKGIELFRPLAALYREECEHLSVTRLDGERPVDELCEEIAKDLWRTLG
jgi:thymidylate kinase